MDWKCLDPPQCDPWTYQKPWWSSWIHSLDIRYRDKCQWPYKNSAATKCPVPGGVFRSTSNQCRQAWARAHSRWVVLPHHSTAKDVKQLGCMWASLGLDGTFNLNTKSPLSTESVYLWDMRQDISEGWHPEDWFCRVLDWARLNAWESFSMCVRLGTG